VEAHISSREVLTISDGASESAIVPGLGAGLAWYDLLIGGKSAPIFRPCRNLSEAHPLDLALNLLVPWSNRISNGGFAFEGEFHPLEPNLPGETFPIHGNAFTSSWVVEGKNSSRATLTLDSSGPGPFRYASTVTYELRSGALSVELGVRNVGVKSLPFGLGLHPWLIRTHQTKLRARSERVVLENGDHLPAEEVDVGTRTDWNFEAPRRLPTRWINNAFLRWDGDANILWPDRGLALNISASPLLTTYVLYSPDGNSDFFCFEPVTHPVDAHNRKDGVGPNRLVVLKPGEETSVWCRFAPTVLP
jgi:aldose 1-epimerase